MQWKGIFMHIESLKYFYEVAMLKSISKAANNSHISQSALSQQIQKLEDSLNCKLLQRSNKGVEITNEGKIVIKYTDNIMKNYNKMLEELSNLDKLDNVITIEACSPMATYALPCTLYDMKKKFANHVYRMSTNSSCIIEQNVLSGIFDLGFIHGKPQDESLSYFDVCYDEQVLVAGNGYKIDNEISGNDILKHPLIIYDDRLIINLREKLNEYLTQYDSKFEDVNIMFTLDSTEAVKAAVMKEYGIAFLPYMSVKKELYTKELKAIDIKNFNAKYSVYLIYKEDDYINNSVMDFVQYFKKIGKKSFC